ncbi:hypothetical protein [Roseobacter weihaiensis]|uniref:hypothetical protein n=1 Tax=Roseobacter weihaiensis TaxID=2763262 RepID=UPI001D0AD8A4|nr:hypothetical protein [Roseobacter sp. H9]
MPDDFSGALAGWSVVAPDDQDINIYAAGYTLLYSAGDTDGLGHPALTEIPLLHSELVSDMEWLVEQVRDDIAAGKIDYFEHASGWHLGFASDREYPTHIDCLFWHDEASSDIIEFLTAPYMSAAPVKVVGGQYMKMESFVLDLDDTKAPIDFSILIADSVSLLDTFLPQLHPKRFAAPAYLLVQFSAFSRENR